MIHKKPSPGEKGNRLRWMRRYRIILQDEILRVYSEYFEVEATYTCHPERSEAESNCEAAPKAGSTMDVCHSAQCRSSKRDAF